MEECHTSHYAQAPRESRRAKRHFCQNYPDDVFQVHNEKKHHPCKIPVEDQLPYFLYIVVAMSNNLSDQIVHAKVCSSYHYEQQKPEGKGADPKLLNLYNLVISSTVPVTRTF